ncbi:MAG: DUF1554 domain-containing protein, partial [Candidatus Sericytochromatia bacterium]|nr:DUF1554 domain-containing protein [Candidatus Tanganyikabacteria bacterium]
SPSAAPTASPSAAPTASPSAAPTASPSAAPTASPSAAPTATPRGYKYIFVGRLGTGNLGGVSGADALCQANRPSSVAAAKAILVNGTVRRACTTANCSGGAPEHVDWPLAPSTEYRDTANVKIGTTNAAGIFPFPLSAGMTGGFEWWSGLNTNWTSNSATCTGWTSGASSVVGIVGMATNTGSNFLNVYLQFCNRTNVQLLCAEQ